MVTSKQVVEAVKAFFEKVSKRLRPTYVVSSGDGVCDRAEFDKVRDIIEKTVGRRINLIVMPEGSTVTRIQ